MTEVFSDEQRAALPFLAWARIWSPLTSREWREESWAALGLPSPFDRFETEFWSVFQAGVPAPRIPLLLHVALARDGGQVREEWMRVMQLLELEGGENRLPPDHLAVACEIFAAALEAGDGLLASELSSRYLLPWCSAADRLLADDETALAVLPASFAAQLAASTS